MSYALYYSGKAPAAFGFWIVTNVVASVFTLVWDLRMDWGLLHLEKVLLKFSFMFSPRSRNNFFEMS